MDVLTEPRRREPYARLVYDTVRALGLSYAEVSRRSGTGPDGLPRLSRQRVQQVVEIPIRRPPDDKTITGLSTALGLSEDTIRDAISETLGLRVLRAGPPSELSEIVDMVGRLPAADQERWCRLARGLIRELVEHPNG